ncbi:MAG: DUF349 domain-containing protein [Flavobacteriales bacterium]|nr:MAG: DUF349 domain-containing protein [Flavobacteriales bacterium]
MSEDHSQLEQPIQQPSVEEKYGSLEIKDMVQAARELLSQDAILRIKADMDYLRSRINDELNAELAEKKEAFIAQGGNEIDFEWNQPLRDEFKLIYRSYREKRKNTQEAIKKDQEANLQRKIDIIEEIKMLAQREESLEETFPAFRALQEAWRNTGPVPKSEMNELYRNYHFYVEAFYDYVQINRELRDLDFKKNAEAKEVIIRKAEALVESDDIVDAMRQLQNLHRDWKETGPVSHADREQMWDRFSAITKRLHDKRDEYEAQRLEEEKNRVVQKMHLCEQLESIQIEKITTHNQWQKTLAALEEAAAAYKSIGYARLPENDIAWERFRAINRNIHRAKNEFYKNLKNEHHENLQIKKALVDKANSLKDSTNWKETSDALKKLQRKWKESGPVSRKDSKTIWEEFRAACDHFFARMKEHYDSRDKEFINHLEAKKALLEQLKHIETPTKEQLMELLQKWRDIGPVPAANREVEFTWNKKVDEAFAAIDMDKQESAIIRYRAKLEAGLQSGPAEVALKKERAFLRQKMDEAKRELAQLNENILRITGDASNPFFKEVRKTQRHREEQIDLIAKKLEVINDLEKVNK